MQILAIFVQAPYTSHWCTVSDQATIPSIHFYADKMICVWWVRPRGQSYSLFHWIYRKCCLLASSFQQQNQQQLLITHHSFLHSAYYFFSTRQFLNILMISVFVLGLQSGELGNLQLIEMTSWLGDKYEGEYKEGWYHGYGKLEMENGIVYEGQFVKGQFHGQGRLIYPNGGYYKATWIDGKMSNGQYIFNDNLGFEKQGWKHCINEDRRFYQQYLHGIKPSGATQQTREDKPHNIPTGTYDTGDGYYEPVKSIIYSYEGAISRTPSEQEVKFIIEKCRYVPKAVDIDGSKDRVIKKVLEIETKK